MLLHQWSVEISYFGIPNIWYSMRITALLYQDDWLPVTPSRHFPGRVYPTYGMQLDGSQPNLMNFSVVGETKNAAEAWGALDRGGRDLSLWSLNHLCSQYNMLVVK